MKTVSSPNADKDSRRAAATASINPEACSTTRMPLPPPPAEALTRTGNPISVAAPTTSRSSVTSTDGRTGTPAATIRRLAESLSPIAAITSGGGPTHVSPASITALAKPAFSERNP